jgi:hypothetical protein
LDSAPRSKEDGVNIAQETSQGDCRFANFLNAILIINFITVLATMKSIKARGEKLTQGTNCKFKIRES